MQVFEQTNYKYRIQTKLEGLDWINLHGDWPTYMDARDQVQRYKAPGTVQPYRIVHVTTIEHQIGEEL